jgi:hypothetical protein
LDTIFGNDLLPILELQKEIENTNLIGHFGKWNACKHKCPIFQNALCLSWEIKIKIKISLNLKLENALGVGKLWN